MWYHLDNFDFRKSVKKNKKYDVFYNGNYITSFGGIHNDKNKTPYTQYFDKIGVYSDYDNFDEKKRSNFKKRHELNRHKICSPAWFSDNYLW